MLELSRISFFRTLMGGQDQLPAFLHRRQLELVTIFISATLKLPEHEPSEYNERLVLSSQTKIDFHDSDLTSATLTGVVTRIPSFFGWVCPKVRYKIKVILYSKGATLDSQYQFQTRNWFCELYFKIFMLKTVENMIENFLSKGQHSVSKIGKIHTSFQYPFHIADEN